MAFHWTLGVPYLPASSLKGLCRFGFEVEEIDQFESMEDLQTQTRSLRSVWTDKPLLDDNRRPRQEQLVRGDQADLQTNPDWPPTVEHFGSQDAMGSVRFLDALPMPDGLALQLDVMNPHYPDYYGQKNDRDGRPIGPTECQNPIPNLVLDRQAWDSVSADTDSSRATSGTIGTSLGLSQDRPRCLWHWHRGVATMESAPGLIEHLTRLWPLRETKAPRSAACGGIPGTRGTGVQHGRSAGKGGI